jgi:uncharacterized membrane-anchored protein
MFAAIIAIPAIGYWRFGMNSILAFWFAYVVPARSARPLPIGSRSHLLAAGLRSVPDR